MPMTELLEAINHQRRRFLGAAAMTIGAAQLSMNRAASAQTGKTTAAHLPAIKLGTNTSFPIMKQIEAGVLNIGYAEAGPADGPVVILLHGWPYDIHSYVDVAPLLASAGYRVIVPYVRGCGSTRFLASSAFRNGQQAAVAVDTIAMMDALKIDRAILAGYDWGAQDGGHNRGTPAGALQGLGFRERLSDRQPRGQQAAIATRGRISVVVPILFCDGSWCARLRQIPA